MTAALLAPLLAEVYLPGNLIEAQSAAVTIETYDSLGRPLSLGGGFFYNSRYEVITARHVVKSASRVVVRTSEGRSSEVKTVAAEDKDWDLVKLVVDAVISASIGPEAVEAAPGDAVLTFGPEDRFDGNGIRRGTVSGVREIQGFGRIVELKAELSPGFSGSPVVDMTGNLVGVVTFEVAGEETVYFAVPSERLAFLSSGVEKPFQEWKQGVEQTTEESKDELYVEGIELLRMQDWQGALDHFTKVVALSPLYVVAYPMMGYCNLHLERWEDAITAYYQALLINPEDGIAYNNISVAYGKLGRWGEAMAASRQAVRINPGDAGFRCGLGIAYGKLGEWERARETFREAATLDPRCAAAYYGLGLSSWALDDTNCAWRCYYVLVELDPELAEGLRMYLEE